MTHTLPNRFLVKAACGCEWIETRPPGLVVDPTAPRVCSSCRPWVPAAVGTSPQGLAMVNVTYEELDSSGADRWLEESMNQDVAAALFSATPARASALSERFGVAWWGSPSEKGVCSCCGQERMVCKGYNGGAHMKARFCVPCTAADHGGCTIEGEAAVG